MKEIKAVLFDMDGVLIDSEPIYAEYERTVYEKYNIPITDEEVMQSIGRPTLEWWEVIQEKYDHTLDAQKVTELEEAHYLDYIRSGKIEGRIMPGIQDTIKRLGERGIKMAIATGSPQEAIRKVLSYIDPEGYVQVGISSAEVEHGKPAPDIFLKAAERLGVSPDECVVVEDSMNGLLAAEAAGSYPVCYQPVINTMDIRAAKSVIRSHPELFEIGLGL